MNILINVEHCHYKLEQYFRQECIKIDGIPQDVTTKNLEDTVIKIFEKTGISINNRMIVACHRLGKTTKTIVEFANIKDVELIFKSKKKLIDINLLQICSNNNRNRNHCPSKLGRKSLFISKSLSLL